MMWPRERQTRIISSDHMMWPRQPDESLEEWARGREELLRFCAQRVLDALYRRVTEQLVGNEPA